MVNEQIPHEHKRHEYGQHLHRQVISGTEHDLGNNCATRPALPNPTGSVTGLTREGNDTRRDRHGGRTKYVGRGSDGNEDRNETTHQRHTCNRWRGRKH